MNFWTGEPSDYWASHSGIDYTKRLNGVVCRISAQHQRTNAKIKLLPYSALLKVFLVYGKATCKCMIQQAKANFFIE